MHTSPVTADGLTGLADLLKGEVAVVTGAGRGNGAAIARGLVQAGARVFLADIDGDAARASAAAIDPGRETARGIAWDIADPSSAVAAVETIHSSVSRVSILVNNAGIEAVGTVNAGSSGFAESWRRVMDVNLDGTMRAVEALLPDLRAGGGSIVNIVSIQSFIAYQSGTSAYATSKAALAQYTRSLAVDLAADGIRVNAIAPGFIETAMTTGTRADPNRLAAFRARTPLKRMGQPMELAGPVVFLVSRLSSYVTGTVLPVDGGMLAQ